MDNRAVAPAKKKNFSAKRQAILEVIRSTKCHPSAEWVYQQLKPQFPNLSLGTVYRNIAQFREDRLVIGVGVVDGHERFDGNVTPHGHFICRTCSCVIDIMDDYIPPSTITSIEKELGVKIEKHALIFHGQCNNCRVD